MFQSDAWLHLFAAELLKPGCLVTIFEHTNTLPDYERLAIHQL
jgi:hypothetical protein